MVHTPIFLHLLKKHYFVTNPLLSQKIFGREFKNPVGLGAGFDKNGQYITAIPSFGFGFTEIGTVTPKPQRGNPKPRLFRLKEEKSLQNGMGFNNYGAKYMIKQLENSIFWIIPSE